MTLPKNFNLTKSHYVAGVGCPYLLWTKLNRPGTLPELDDSARLRMEQGTKVGVLARDLFKNSLGILTKNTNLALSLTQTYLKNRKPMYEPAFKTQIDGLDCLARVDILNPVGKDSWELIEVKSSTKVKEEHLNDVAFQLHVLESAGINVHACSVMHINKEYILGDKLNLKEFLTKEDVTDQLAPYLDAIQENVSFLKATLTNEKAPQLLCPDPKDCPACSSVLPKHSVFDLYRGKSTAHKLWEKGIKTIDKIPHTTKLSDKQHMQQSALLSGQMQIKRQAIQEFLDSLQYPLGSFDFESFSEAIPRFKGTKPYQQIPFQYSLEVLQANGANEHKEYLAPSDGTDPRYGLFKQMYADVKDIPLILAYHEPFEKMIINQLGEAFPEFLMQAQEIINKLGDLAEPFKNFYLYHPQQQGSASLKYVLPSLTNVSYENLDINNGALASAKFLESLKADPTTKEKIRKDLLEYCKQDTQGPIAILDSLKNL